MHTLGSFSGRRAIGLVGRRRFLQMAAGMMGGGLASRLGRGTAVPGLRFTDVAPRSQFFYRTRNGYDGHRKYFPQPMCGGVALFDYDNDGRLDIFLSNGAECPSLRKSDPGYYNCLLRNRGDGTFEDVTERAGLLGKDLGYCFGVAAADFDNDGHTDLFICNAGRNALYHNNGDGTFTDITAGSGLEHKPENELSVCAAWVDYNNDGLLDLVVSQYTVWTPGTDLRCVTESDRDYYCPPTKYKNVPSRLYRNRGDGKFEDVTESSGLSAVAGKGMGIAVADFTGNGLMDIFIACDTERNLLFVNQGNGTFKEQALLYGVAYNDLGVNVSGMGCHARDFNNDGWVDIFYNDLANQIYALFGNHQGKFFDYLSQDSHIAGLSRAFAGWSCAMVDYDNDGWLDLYSANGDVDNLDPNTARQHDTLWKNQGGTGFADVSLELGADFLRSGYQRGAAWGDLNNDGFPDLVVTSLDERPRILVNSANNGHHWVLLDLRGHSSNRDAIGARARVETASGRLLFNHVSPAMGFMSSADRRLQFGVGEETRIRQVQIDWPSGRRQILRDLRADHIHVVEEPR